MILHYNASNGLASCKNALPEYCYNIFDKVRSTSLAILPKLSETISGDFDLATKCKTVEEAKKVLKIDWFRLGRLFGFGIRSKRLVQLETEDELKRDGLFDDNPEKQKKAIELLIGKRPEQESSAVSVGAKLHEMLKSSTEPEFEKIDSGLKYFGQVAYQWGSDAMENFSKGIAEGLAGFIDENGQLVGETNRSPTYWFLLLAWPEIKELQASQPRKTVTDLHNWMLPFMRFGFTSLIDVETLRDVCTPPPSGIGLSLRPLKVRLPKSSA